MISAIKVFFIAIRLSIARSMAFRADFFISSSIMLLSELFLPLVAILIYKKGVSFPGWTLYEVLLIQSIYVMSKGIGFPLFIGMVFNIMYNVRMGTLDLMLVRPRSMLFTLIISGFNLPDFGKFIGGLGLFTFAIYHLPIPGVLDWVNFILLFVVSLGVIFAFTILLAVYAVRFIGSYHVLSLIEPISQFGQYPTNIFNLPMRIIINSIVPVAIIGFLPASVLLHKASGNMLPTVIMAFLFVAGSLLLWRKALSKYTSAGG